MISSWRLSEKMEHSPESFRKKKPAKKSDAKFLEKSTASLNPFWERSGLLGIEGSFANSNNFYLKTAENDADLQKWALRADQVPTPGEWESGPKTVKLICRWPDLRFFYHTFPTKPAFPRKSKRVGIKNGPVRICNTLKSDKRGEWLQNIFTT